MRSPIAALRDASIESSAWVFDVWFYLNLLFERLRTFLSQRRSVMSAAPHPVLDLETSMEANHVYSLQEDRYWGIQATLERIDGRLLREEYYVRLANHEDYGSVKASRP